ncbi:MAG: hypothetical protein ACE15F_20000 [bacterium]
MINTKGMILFMTLCVMVLPGYAQYGIFDKTADWGGTDSPPQRGSFKVPGSVTIAGSGAGAVYDLQGNGDDIWDNNDEGFFVYTEKAGSWRLTAKVQWIYNGGGNEWAKAGVMMRETGNSATSRHYWIELRAGTSSTGDRTDTQWRTTTGSTSLNTQILENGADVADPGDGLYLRITRYAEIDLVVSEYSVDGTNWVVAHSMIMDFPDSIAWGLAITNHNDVDDLAEATLSNVSLEQVEGNPFTVTRSMSAKTFAPGQTITTTLKIQNMASAASNVTITETPPAGFAISEISNGGTESGGVISWSLSASPGETLLTYKVTVPASYDPKVSGYRAQWSGTDGVLNIFGTTSMFLVDVSVGETLFSFDFENANQLDQWEDLAGVFDIANGQFFEIDDAGGPLVTLTGDPTLTDVAVTVKGMGLVADADWGIVVRCTDLGNMYSWQFVNGYLRVLSYVGGTRTEPLGVDITYAEELNVWREFTLIVKGNVLYAFFDGVCQGVVVDDNLTEGQVGLFGWVNSGTDLSNVPGGIAFDDFVVSKVGGAPVGVEQWSLY